mgnify:CR=1 FL=1
MRLTIELKADGSGLTGTVRVAKAELDGLAKSADNVAAAGRRGSTGLAAVDTAARRATGGLSGTESAARRTGAALATVERNGNGATQSVRELASGVSTLQGTLATLGIAFAAREFLGAGMAMNRFNTSLAGALGTQEAVAREMGFLRAEADRLGIFLPNLIQGYTGLTAATRGTNLESAKTRDIFLGVAEGARAMNLTAENTAGVLTAMQQIAGKGVVSMEELRLQLGDRLPGAMQIAARSMNMPMDEFMKMVASGELLSEVFLPRFAEELRRSSAAGVEFARNSPAAEFERLKTAIFEFAADGSSGAVLEALAGGARSLTDALREATSSGAAQALGEGLAAIIRQLDTLAIAVTAFYALKLGAYLRTQAADQLAAVAATQAAVAAERERAAAAIATAQARAAEVQQTLRVIEAARAEQVAKLALARAEQESAQRTLAATQNMMALSSTLRARRDATEAATAAQLRLNAVTNELAMLGRQQVALQGQLAGAAAAQVAAQGQLAAAVGRTGAAMQLLQRAGSGLFALMGGWTGVAIAAVAAIYAVTDSMAREREERYANTRSLEELNGQMRREIELRQLVTEGKASEANAQYVLSLQQQVELIEETNTRLARQQEINSLSQTGLMNVIALEVSRRLAMKETSEELDRANAVIRDQFSLMIESGREIPPMYREMAEEVRAYGEAAATAASFVARLLSPGSVAPDAGAEIESQLNAIAVTSGLTEAQLKLVESLEKRTAAMGKSQAQLLQMERAEQLLTATTQEQRREIEAAYGALIAATQAQEGLTEAKRREAEVERERQRAERDAELAREARQFAMAREQQLRDEGMADAQQLLADLREESQLIGLSADELERYNVIKQLNNDLTRAGVDLGSEEAARLREQATAQLAANQAKWRAVEIAGEYQRRWLAAIEDVSFAFAEFATGQIRSLRDLTKELLNIVKRWVTQVLAELVKIQIAKFFGGAGGNLGAAAMSILGGGGGGGGSLLSSGASLVGGGGSSGGFNLGSTGTGNLANSGLSWLGNSPAAQQALTYAPYLAAAGGAAYGFQNRGGSNGSGGSLAATAAYGYAGYALGTVATGALLGAGAGAATGVAGATIGGAVSGGVGAAAAIPVVGWIVAALALIDAFSGGKLFGTRYKPDEMTSSIGIQGGEAFTESSLTEVRNRSLFRGRQWRTTALEDSPEAVQAAQALFDAVDKTMADAARQLRGTAPELLDVAIRTVQDFDSKGRATTSKLFVDVLGRSWEEATQELAATRITAEAIISTIDQVMGTTVQAVAQGAGEAFREGVDAGLGGGGADRVGEYVTAQIKAATAGVMGEASAIAERWRDDAEQLLAGAQFLLLAASEIRRGAGLLGEAGSLSDITNLIEDLQRGEETLVQTYQRVSQAAQLLDQALAMSGVEIDATREQLVRFAVDIADAAGGIERAQQLWSNFFQRFYTDSERAAVQSNQLDEFARGQFGEIGLDLDAFTGTGGAALFRQLFEEALPTLSADAVVQWLEAAEALGLVLDAQAQYTAAIQQQVAAQMQAIAEYEAAAQTVRDELAEAGMSEFAIALRDVARWTEDTTAELNNAARAAGFQAAAEEDLAAVHQVAANRAAAAIRQLMSAAGDLVAELYGTPLDQINAQIAAIEGMYQSQVDGLNAVGQAAEDVYGAQLAALQDIQQWLDAQRFGDTSTLTPQERIAEARRQFEALLPAAQSGDVDALRQITQLGDTLLREGRSFYASSEPFTELEAFVRGALQGLVNAGPTAQPLGPNTGGSTGGGGFSQGSISPDLQALYAERDALMAQQEAERRAALVAELAQMIRELIQATGQPLEEIAAAIGLNLADLAGDLGINLQDLSVSTATGLVDMARQLGVDVAELATNVGVSLGDLGDRQSLLNQALDATLNSIPEEFRAQLRQPLEDIRNATSAADANAALDDLIGVSRGFPAGIRDLLAPYFAGLNPSQTITELGTLRTISSIGEQQLEVLRQIRVSLAGQGPQNIKPNIEGPAPAEPPAPPPAPPKLLSVAGVDGGPLAVDSPELAAELRALNDQIQRSLEALGDRVRGVEAAVEASAESNVSTQRALADLLRTR